MTVKECEAKRRHFSPVCVSVVTVIESVSQSSLNVWRLSLARGEIPNGPETEVYCVVEGWIISGCDRCSVVVERCLIKKDRISQGRVIVVSKQSSFVILLTWKAKSSFRCFKFMS